MIELNIPLPVGKISAVATIAGTIGGALFGYNLGQEAVEFSRTMAEPGLLEHMVANHPVLTETVSTIATAYAGYAAGMFTGYADLILGTHWGR